MVTTMTTVGYGDMTIGTDNARQFCVLLMLISVIIFGFVSGSIASNITLMAEADAPLQRQLDFLTTITENNNIDNNVYHDIKNHINESFYGEDDGMKEWIDTLPLAMKMKIINKLHHETFQHTALNAFKRKHLALSFIAFRLK